MLENSKAVCRGIKLRSKSPFPLAPKVVPVKSLLCFLPEIYPFIGFNQVHCDCSFFFFLSFFFFFGCSHGLQDLSCPTKDWAHPHPPCRTPQPCQWEHGALTTGLPGNSQFLFSSWAVCLDHISTCRDLIFYGSICCNISNYFPINI